MNTRKQYWSIVFLAVLLCISVSSCSYAAERYMMCTGTGVRVRANPSTKAEIISELNKEPILVVDEKNTGEKFLWYKVSLEDEYDSYGWVYGQFLRKMKTRQDYNLDSVNGIGWGTSSSQISDFNLIAKSEIEDSDPIHYLFKPDTDWAYVATKTEDYKEGNIIVPAVVVSYVFDSQKRMKGFFFAVRLQDRDTDLLKAHGMILEKLGESEDVMKNTIDGGDIMFYDFNEFKAAFGTLYSNEIGDILLIYGVFKKDIAPVDKFNFIALCKTGSVQEIEAAIKAGADVNAKDKDEVSPLMWAAAFNPDPKVITALVKAGANISAKSKDDLPPLVFATMNSNPEIIITLIKAGLDVNTRYEDGSTSLMLAAGGNSNPEIIVALIKAGANVNARDERGFTSLMYAAENNAKPEIITTLIKAGADVNAKNKNFLSPIMLAAKNNTNPKVITALINAGANVDEREGIDESTPLMFTILNKNGVAVAIALINVLINAGADINAKDMFGATLLMYAAENNPSPEILTTLIKLGADVNAKNKSGSTALIDAARRNTNPNVITILLDAGADAHARDKDFKRAIDYAKDNKNIVNTDAFWKLNDASY